MKYILGLFLISFFILENVVVGEDLPLYPTMKKSEFMKIVDCMNEAKTVAICVKHDECLNKYPAKVLSAYHTCIARYPNEGSANCVEGKPMISSPAISSAVYDCKAGLVLGKLTPEDNAKLSIVENCFRIAHLQTCKHP